MTGFRLGFLAGPKAVVEACATVQGQITSCASSLAQAAGLAALALRDDDLAPLVAAMATKRDFVFSKLQAMPRVVVPRSAPSGAFYLLPEIDAFFARRSGDSGRSLSDSTVLCVALLAETGLALVPGDAFGAPKSVRISYAASMEELADAMERLGGWLARTTS